MGSVDLDQVSIAFGVNNAIVCTASLGAIAVILVAFGLMTAIGLDEITEAVWTGLIIVVVLAAVAGLLCFVGLAFRVAWCCSVCWLYCVVDGLLLQLDLACCLIAG